MKRWVLTSALLITVLCVATVIAGCAEISLQTQQQTQAAPAENSVQTVQPSQDEPIAETTAEITAGTLAAETTVDTTQPPSETGSESASGSIPEPESGSPLETQDEQTEHMEHVQLELRYGAVTGRVSLDQELFETHMGDTGRNAANNDGELSDTQVRILDACASTPAAAAHYCAAWISSVFENAGIYGVGGNANDMWENYCYSDSFDALQPGMIMAVLHSRTDQDSDGYIYGHVGIYIGNGYVIHSTTVEGEGTKVITSLDDWLDRYDPYETVKWGFPE